MGATIEQLFERFRKHADAEALGGVFDRTAPGLLRLALEWTGSISEAEDLLQETFLVAIEAAPRFESGRRLEPWLVGILTNRAKEARRRRRRAPEHGADELADRAPSPAVDDTRREVVRAVAALPDPYRPVLLLHLGHDLGPAEIAAVLDRPPARVRVQLHRGLERLRKALPAGVSAGVVLASTARGLDGVRTAVLDRSTPHVAAATLPVGGGAAIMMKKVMVVVAIAAVSWLAFGSGRFSADEDSGGLEGDGPVGDATPGERTPRRTGAETPDDGPPHAEVEVPDPAPRTTSGPRGRVVLPGGGPAVNAEVSLHPALASVQRITGHLERVTRRLDGLEPMAVTRTDERGDFVFAATSLDGPFSVFASLAPHGPGLAEAVTNDEPASIRLSRSREILAVVVDGEGRALEGVRAAVHHAAAADLRGNLSVVSRHVTDAAGRLTLRCAEPGAVTPVRLVLRKDGFVTEDLSLRGVSSGRELRLRMKEARAVTVVFEPEGGVELPATFPFLLRTRRPSYRSEVSFARAGEPAVVPFAPCENLQVILGLPGLSVAFDDETYGPGDLGGPEFPVARKGDLVLRVPVTRGGRVEGVLTDSISGDPVADAVLEAEPNALNGLPAAACRRRITTDERGRFVLTGLRECWTTLRVTSAEWMLRTPERRRDDRVRLDAGTGRSLLVFPRSGAPILDLTLSAARTARLTGRVIDTAGRAIAGASVEFARLRVTADADGRFVADGLPPLEKHRPRFTFTGKRTRRGETLSLDPGEQRDLGDVVLEDGLVVEIGVADDSRLPVRGAAIVAERQSGFTWRRVGTATSDPRGRARLLVEGPGELRLRVENADALGFRPEPARGTTVDVKDTGTTSHDVVLAGATRLAALVVDEEGRPLTRVRVRIEPVSLTPREREFLSKRLRVEDAQMLRALASRHAVSDDAGRLGVDVVAGRTWRVAGAERRVENTKETFRIVGGDRLAPGDETRIVLRLHE